VREAGLGTQVTFLGALNDAALPGLYAAADIFVMPNRTDGVDFEGFGIVFLEAAAAGLPCIAGNSGGAPEAILDGETGLLVSGTNIEELLECMRKLACSPELRRRLGLRGRDRVLDAFTWQHGSRRLRQVHDSITAEA